MRQTTLTSAYESNAMSEKSIFITVAGALAAIVVLCSPNTGVGLPSFVFALVALAVITDAARRK